MMNLMSRRFSEVIAIPTFQERIEYLKLDGIVGADTFGWNRYLNQTLYRSSEWRKFRREVILRDNGCDLAHSDYPVSGRYIIIHHLNPITVEDIINRSPVIFDLENVICVSHQTHNIIHYGDTSQIPKGIIERTPNDMCPWK